MGEEKLEAAEKKSDSEKTDALKQTAETAVVSEDEEEEEDGFADALSTGHEDPAEHSPENSTSASDLPQVQVQETENDPVQDSNSETKGADQETEKLTVDTNNANLSSTEEAGLKTPTGSSGSSSSSSNSAPPLPRRSDARRAVPAPPVPSKESDAPALPPRARTPSANTVIQNLPQTPRTPSVVSGPPPKRALPFNVEIESKERSQAEILSWEEKTWLEVARLREEMWKARMGLQEIEDEDEEEEKGIEEGREDGEVKKDEMGQKEGGVEMEKELAV